MNLWGIGQASPVHFAGMAAFMAIFVPFVFSLIRAGMARGKESGGAKPSAISRLGIGIQMIGFFIVGWGQVTLIMGWPTGAQALIALATAALSLASLLIFHSSRKALAQNWSIVARTRNDHQLVTSGPYAAVRHPIYGALFCWLLAMALAFGHYAALVLAVPLFCIGMVLRTREEERLLRAMFGPAYDAYAARVKRFIPHVI